MPANSLRRFAPATAAWFTGALGAPTPAQAGAWAAVAADRHALVVAPTGSGKTLAAFLWALDRLLDPATPEPEPVRRCRVVYVSPLKALAADVERNLRAPLAGIAAAAARRGETIRTVTIGTRTGDTPPSERRRFALAPPDILITTPESLFLILTSGARAGLSGVDTVIIDEIHAVAGTKRGAHLAVSLERLDELTDAPVQRIGLSATVTPVEAVASFLSGHRPLTEGGRVVDVVQPASTKRIEIDVVVPVPDLGDLAAAPAPQPSRGRRAAGGATNGAGLGPGTGADDPAAPRPIRPSVWPHVEERVVDLVTQNRSTLVFTNSRRGAERLTTRMNEVWAERQGEEVSDPGERHAAHVQAQSGAAAGLPPVLARAHHGSMSRAERTVTETELKEGRLPSVVSTSSLELGIDMGSIDLVVQIGAPPSVASGLQRVGRAGHQVGAVSRGVIFPMHRGDLVPCVVIAERMRTGSIEALAPLNNPLDVLAQQIVAMVAVADRTVDDVARLVRRSAPFAALGDGVLHAVLDMLSGRYPSEDFGELRARLVWDRTTGRLTARPGALRLAVTSGGTIPDRGLYGVFLAAGADGAPDDRRARGGKRVGELDEEMVYESRVGDTFTLGSSTWRIEDITHDRVLVTPAPGVPGRLPFWKGDSPGRPAELGRAIGAWLREATTDVGAAVVAGAPSPWPGLDAWAGDNVRSYLTDQLTATGVLPDDRTIVVERFRDELGDWRVVIHSPFGAKVHAPWALVLAARIRDRFGIDAATMHSDDGIVLRLPDLGDQPTGPGSLGAADGAGSGGPSGTASGSASGSSTLDLTDLLISPEDVQTDIRRELGQSALFGARFREAAARALLLPRRRPDQRQPLWQQRQRSAQLLAVASAYPDFPIVLEAVRECLQEDFDIASLTALMAELEDGRIQVVEVSTPSPSPFAQSLLFGYTTQFIYDGDAPLAERRAAALTLDPDLLAELLGQDGQAQIADLLDPAAVTRTEAELGGLAEDRQARSAEDVWDLLRRMGPLTTSDVADRTREPVRPDVAGWLFALEADRRVFRLVGPGPGGPDAGQQSAGTGQREGDPDGARWAVVEDAGRLRDALGVAVPAWVPEVFTTPVPDAVGDLVRRFARTHGPFTARQLASALGIGVAVVEPVLRLRVTERVLVAGRLRPDVLRGPGGTGEDFCDADVLRTLRRRSLAALRADVEPVRQETLGAFLPRWQSVGALRGTEGLFRVVEQLAGAALPASAVESQILPARVADYSPAMLDELTTSGEVLWCGHRELPGTRGGKDALISLHLAESAPLTLPALDPDLVESTRPDLHVRLLDLLSRSGGFFLGQLATSVDAPVPETLAALWDLVWASLVTNDGLGPVRSRLGQRTSGIRSPARSVARPRPMGRRPHLASLSPPTGIRSGPGGAYGLPGDPGGGGRWSALPPREGNPTLRTHAQALILLDRHGVLTRAVAASENMSGSYGDIYRVLGSLETAGRVRRGYFVEHLGGSQFALPGAVDRLRTTDGELVLERARGASLTTTCLASTDPANPYGAALAWPASTPTGELTAGHRPGRKVGASVVLAAGELVFYLERGGRSLLTFTDDQCLLDAGARGLAAAISAGHLATVRLRTIDGNDALLGASGIDRPAPLAALLGAGFGATPSGIRLAR
ncbi:DEAD/DEAH box helicase [Sanguibacter gelidistatuariae]|uniref:DEAD/DEAH box helicase n=1 Tax=Sanguibacter gelidistatuariae TaxID=1814289 RepID=UPI000B8A348E|nr:DEAD/DEAH box helicase [Sanguibacter gelidistatuariae]